MGSSTLPAPDISPTNDTVVNETPKRKNSARQILLNILKIGISITLIYFLLRDTSISEVLAAVKTANVPLLILAFSLHFIGFLVSAYRWRGLLRAQSKNASIRYLMQSYIVSAFFNNFLPSTIGGDAIRAYDSWKLGQTKSEAVAVVFVDRFLGILVLMLFAVVAVLFSPQLTENVPSLYPWVGLGTFAVVVVSWLIFVPSQWMPKLLQKLPIPGKIKEKLLSILSAFLAFQGKKQVLTIALIWSVILQVNVVFHHFLISEALGLQIPLAAFFLIVPLATFIMMIPISINAIGVRESVFVLFFSAYAISSSEAIAFSWIIYGMVLILGVIGGITYALRRQ